MGSQNHRIDLHYHVIPKPYVEALAERGIRGSTYVPFPTWTPEKALRHMDRAHVSTAVTSLSTPGVWFGDRSLARRLSRLCNEFQAQMAADHPERFGSLACLPLPDVDGALAELEYALDDLEHDGVALLTDVEGSYLGDPEYEELFAELDRRGSVVFIHPHDDPNRTRRYDLFSPLLEWPVHTTRAVMDLLYTGRLARYRSIRYILAHGGGAVPYLAHRIASGGHGGDPGLYDSPVGLETFHEPLPPREFVEERLSLLRGLYFDTSSPGQSHLAVLQEFAEPDHLLFGTDGGWTPPIQTAQTIRGLLTYDGFDADQLARVERGNAIRLFPRFQEVIGPPGTQAA